MSDYISRSALIAEIKKYSSHGLTEWSTLGVLAAVDRIPAADVRKVVLCKDCVHYVCGELFGDMVCDYHYLHHYHAEPNEFCSHAEKMEEQT